MSIFKSFVLTILMNAECEKDHCIRCSLMYSVRLCVMHPTQFEDVLRETAAFGKFPAISRSGIPISVPASTSDRFPTTSAIRTWFTYPSIISKVVPFYGSYVISWWPDLSLVPFSSGMYLESGIRPFPSRFSHSHCTTDIRQLSRPRGVQLTLRYQDTSNASPHSDVATQQLFRL